MRAEAGRGCRPRGRRSLPCRRIDRLATSSPQTPLPAAVPQLSGKCCQDSLPPTLVGRNISIQLLRRVIGTFGRMKIDAEGNGDASAMLSCWR